MLRWVKPDFMAQILERALQPQSCTVLSHYCICFYMQLSINRRRKKNAKGNRLLLSVKNVLKRFIK